MEFGHGLHHMLTEIDVAAVSGINGVAWDAVELPSQFMENWCWTAEGLALISSHVDNQAPLPTNLLDKLLAARNFQSGLMTLRQIEFALFDLEIHRQQDVDFTKVLSILDSVREVTSVMPPPAWNRFACSFSHILPAVMRPVITAINGRKCCLLMRSRPLSKKAFLMPVPANVSVRRYWLVAARNLLVNCSVTLWVVIHSLMHCYATLG